MKPFPVIMVSILLFSSCRLSKNLPEESIPTRFESTFPEIRARDKFSGFTGSVLRLSSFVNYRTHVFEPDSLITLSDLIHRTGPGTTRARLVSNESFAGTALLISVNGNRGLLLTCAHNVVFPDTVCTFLDKASPRGERYLLAFSEKTGQLIQISGGFGTLKGRVIAIDEASDLALAEIESGDSGALPGAVGMKPVFVRHLEWGDRVWLCGYPSGKFMMTSGILSNPGHPEGVMLTDAPFSEGYSGAPAIVYDRRAGEFLMAGLGRSVAARSEYVLRPENRIYETVYNTSLPYTGPAYVETVKQTVPGITFIVSSDKIADFLASNAVRLEASGWSDILSSYGITEEGRE